ncbi:MAG TPA: zinc-ribbon domain-containing protein [Pyrinomonadaceae bacterium]|nr:zinc-ribbon domain-containing protein [Pyrinomonadaceae bacterium]
MFCPKCGTQNPETGKFCRSCGTDLGNVSDALTGKLPQQLVNNRGRTISLESAFTKLSMGVAFIAIAIIAGASGMGRGWWYWMLIPALMFIGSGIAQYIQVRSAGGSVRVIAPDQNILSGSAPNAVLPPTQTDYVAAESRYKTGDLVPPSVTDSTTRHLETNSEGETMTLPKR